MQSTKQSTKRMVSVDIDFPSKAKMTKRKKSLGVILINVAVYLLAIVFLIPFALSLLMAIKTPQETAVSFFALPSTIHWENFTQAAVQAKILQSFTNSIIVTVSTVVLVIICGSTAGYAIGRLYHKKTLRTYQMIILASMMVPFQTIMIPIYQMFRELSLLNTQLGLVLILVALNFPFAVLLYVGFIRTIPKELEEAAMMDGYGPFRIFFHIILPLVRPITMVVSTLIALWTWNEFTVSILILQEEAVKTIPMQQYVFFGQYSSNYNLAFAAAVVTMIPILIFFLVTQRYIEKGLTDGAVKG